MFVRLSSNAVREAPTLALVEALVESSSFVQKSTLRLPLFRWSLDVLHDEIVAAGLPTRSVVPQL